jgi:hypothetical protein
MAAGTYNLVMEEGAFTYEVPMGKTVKESILSVSLTIQDSGSTPQPTTVTPTVSLSPSDPIKSGETLVLTINNVLKATLATEAQPYFLYADGLQEGERVNFAATILSRRSDTEFYVNTTGLMQGKYTLVMPKTTFAYVVEEGQTLNDVELTATFEVNNTGTTSPEDFRYIFDAYIIFFPASRYRTSGYYKDIDLNEFILYIDPSMYPGLVANPAKEVKVVTTGGGIVMTGRFVNYPEFAQDYGSEFAGTYAIKFVPDRPLVEGELDGWPGIYNYYCEPATFGDDNYGRWLAGDTTVTPSMCRVNPRMSIGNILVYNSRVTDGIETVKNSDTTASGIYDLQGRRVTTTSKKGVYIMNGKCVFVK